jgi:hypothetical protein
MNEYWERVDREASEYKDSYLALDRVHAMYGRFDPEKRDMADQVLSEWVLSDQEGKRFDAIALIREFEITSAIPALRELAARLESSEEPGAPFEREKVEGLVEELSGDATRPPNP